MRTENLAAVFGRDYSFMTMNLDHQLRQKRNGIAGFGLKKGSNLIDDGLLKKNRSVS